MDSFTSVAEKRFSVFPYSTSPSDQDFSFIFPFKSKSQVLGSALILFWSVASILKGHVVNCGLPTEDLKSFSYLLRFIQLDKERYILFIVARESNIYSLVIKI